MDSQPIAIQRPKRLRCWQGWELIAILPPLVIAVGYRDWPKWVFMWVLVFSILYGCKWLTWRRTPVRDVPVWKHLAYLLGWPGLDAHAFLSTSHSRRIRKPSLSEWLFGIGKVIFGIAILYGVAPLVDRDQEFLLGWVGMLGLIFVLHFGCLHLLSCFWQNLGIDAKPLMKWPIAARSLSEFWGKRWNTAFRDLTHRFFFRPVSGRYGPRVAIAIGFIFSALVHELVISFPAKGGYGGPSVYFIVQGLGIFIERNSFGRKIGLASGWKGWLFAMVVLLSPAVLLFHRPFVTEIIVPFMQAIGAIE